MNNPMFFGVCLMLSNMFRVQKFGYVKKIPIEHEEIFA